ncbi:hypothetical protein AAC387_Pa03g0242 [Persea americana]
MPCIRKAIGVITPPPPPPPQKEYVTLDVVFHEEEMYYSAPESPLQGESRNELESLDELETLNYSFVTSDSTNGDNLDKKGEGINEASGHILDAGNSLDQIEEDLPPPVPASPCQSVPLNQLLSQSDSIPKSQEALRDPRWKEAMNEEMKSLQKNSTWEVGDLPEGKKPVGCRWVFTIKYKADGTIERYKARLVAKGYTQTYGIDYMETFALVAKINTVRILLSLAVNLDWPLHQFDVKNAFLHGDLQEEVYMELPPGCNMQLEGSKQAFGYKQSNSDHTLFLKHNKEKITALIVYVDDMIVTGNDLEERKALQNHLAREFEMKDLGPLKYFLGIEVVRSKKGIFLSQRKYALDLLNETGMSASSPVSTPMEENLKLGMHPNQIPANKERYQRLVGRLMYLAHTQPDLAYALSVVSQFMHAPSEEHMNAVTRILRYLKSSPGKGIMFTKGDNLDIEGYTDADWAGSIDDIRSTSGYFTFVGGNLVTWRRGSTTLPKGWELPTNGKKPRIGVPVKDGFSEFVTVERNLETNTTSVTGFCIDVFNAVVDALPYALPYEFIPFENAHGTSAGTYNDLIYQVYLQKINGVVGDTTIIANRSLYVDFTLPYTESGVSMIVPIKGDQRKNAWIFLKPLSRNLWLTTWAAFVITGIVVWLLEHRVNKEFRGPRSQQFGISFWYSFSSLAFAHKERLVSNLSRFVVIIWVFVVLIITSSYTASLTSMLTVQKLQPTVTDVKDLIKNGDYVGYQQGSFVLGLLKRLNFDESKIKEYNTTDEYAAIFDEIPYIRLFLANRCDQYTMVGPTYKTDGFGFIYDEAKVSQVASHCVIGQLLCLKMIMKNPTKFSFSLILLYSLGLLTAGCCLAGAQNKSLSSSRTVFDVGVVLDLRTSFGKMGESCISMALADFYTAHTNYTTQLKLHWRDSNQDNVDTASMALDLLNNVQVKAILGPQTSSQVQFVAELGNKANVPILSFSSTSPLLSTIQTPYCTRTALSDSCQVKAIAAVVKAFEWREVVQVCQDNPNGNGITPYLTDALQEVEARVPYRSVISHLMTDDQIAQELYKMETMQTRVFIVHLSPSLSSRLFLKANEIGMMREGHVWIITYGLANHLDSMNSSVIQSMQGVLGVKPYFPKSKELDNFTVRWKREFFNENPNLDRVELNIFGLWAYDTVWALAKAVEKVQKTRLGVSAMGPKLRDVILKTNFNGLSGQFNLNNGQLESSAFEIVNVIGKGDRVVGFWTPIQGLNKKLNANKKTYSTSKVDLNPN